MYGDADRVCPMSTVEWMMGQIGHMVYGNYQFGGYDHADFGKANDDVLRLRRTMRAHRELSGDVKAFDAALDGHKCP